MNTFQDLMQLLGLFATVAGTSFAFARWGTRVQIKLLAKRVETLEKQEAEYKKQLQEKDQYIVILNYALDRVIEIVYQVFSEIESKARLTAVRRAKIKNDTLNQLKEIQVLLKPKEVRQIEKDIT